jgi:hypothetical protein
MVSGNQPLGRCCDITHRGLPRNLDFIAEWLGS